MLVTFDDIKEELKKKLSILSNWEKTLYFGVYERIIDVVAYALVHLIYLIEFYFKESFLTSSTTRSAITSHVEPLSYTPHRCIGARGYLIITNDKTGFLNTFTNTKESLIINKWTSFHDEDKIANVYCTQDTPYSSGNKTFTVTLTDTAILKTNGSIGITLENADNFNIGEEVYIHGTSYYNGFYIIQNKIANEIFIKTTFVEEAFDNECKITTGLIKIPVAEGTPKKFVYEAKGIPNETFTVYDDTIDNNDFEVWITDDLGAKKEQVIVCGELNAPRNLHFVTDTNKRYCEVVNNKEYSSVKVITGDTLSSKGLIEGEYITLFYATTNGAKGNIQSKNSIVAVSDTLHDINNEEATPYVTNLDAITNGQDIESLESIKNNAPALFNAGYSCSNYSGWLAVLKNHPKINKATIWSSDDVVVDSLTINPNNVYISAISQIGGELSEIDKKDISLNYLKELKSPTEVAIWKPLNIMCVRIKVDAKIKGDTKTNVENALRNMIINKYSVVKTEFRQPIYESDFYGLIQQNVNILRHTSELYYLEGGYKYNVNDMTLRASNLASDETNLENQNILQENSLEIFVKYVGQERELIASDVSGSLVVENGWTLTDTTFVPSENRISFRVEELSTVDEATYEVFISYKMKDGNNEQYNSIRLPSFDMITDIDEDWIDFDLGIEL